MNKISPPFKFADELITKFKINEPPIDLNIITRNSGIRLIYKDLPDDISGILKIEDDKACSIFVNDNHCEERQRFTIAHELGHYFLHKKIGLHIDKNFYYRNKKSSEAIIKEEIDANKFAAELLIPTKFIQKFLKKHNEHALLEEDVITKLANLFKVSVTAMSFKIQNLGYSF